MVKSPGRSAFTGVQIVVTGPPTLKCETAALTTSITLVVHPSVVHFDIVALTKLAESYQNLFSRICLSAHRPLQKRERTGKEYSCFPFV